MSAGSIIKKGILHGIGILIPLLFVGLVGALFADSLNSFSSGETISSSKMNANFEKMPPVGAIIAWHKTMTGVSSTLPDGWLECDGQTVMDTESTMHLQAVPDLNTNRNSWNTRGSFLRGDSTSGTFEDDEFQGHYHFTGGVPQGTADITSPTGPPTQVWMGSTNKNTGNPVDGANGTVRSGDETKPVSMSVVWIIRIK